MKDGYEWKEIQCGTEGADSKIRQDGGIGEDLETQHKLPGGEKQSGPRRVYGSDGKG